MKSAPVIVKANEEKLIYFFWKGEEKEIFYDVILSEEGASVTLAGLLLGSNANTVDIHIKVTHNAPHTKSEVVIKGALDNLSKVNFEGLVKIKKGAKGTNSWLAAYLLILSDQAKGRAVPSLEIEENDIKAGHATTVGKVNELELFYLQTRGLSAHMAKKLIVQGFLSSVLQSFPSNLQKKIALKIKYD